MYESLNLCRLGSELVLIPQEDIRKAAIIVACNAINSDDCAYLLDVLGIDPSCTIQL